MVRLQIRIQPSRYKYRHDLHQGSQRKQPIYCAHAKGEVKTRKKTRETTALHRLKHFEQDARDCETPYLHQNILKERRNNGSMPPQTKLRVGVQLSNSPILSHMKG